ncbi:MAG: choice-of-anchor L domain-containing protein [Deltaproteobacteria bacterium]|nr:choice-of-anchor L domain-containing protein [Nannocystaceae bacterium]
MTTRRLAAGLLLALGCEQGERGRGGGSAGIDPSVASVGTGAVDDDGGTDVDAPASDDSSGSEGEGEDDGPAGGDGAPAFDIGAPDGAGSEETGCATETCVCTIPEHSPCDAGTNDPFRALGLNCPGELQVEPSTAGPAGAIGLRDAFGGTNTFAPREGSLYAVIGSGLVADLDHETPGGDEDAFPTHCNDDLGNFDPGGMLPMPLATNDVGGDCGSNPALVGTGDCSNTIHEQFSQGNEANDYVELRFELDVPIDVVSFSYDFAFFSTEYPYYYGSPFNDMYIGWLESEQWTGNISFDQAGSPISLNAGFLDYRDDAGNLPELDGTCMKQHAGTGWLTTTAGVTGGEHITVVFAIFDLSDSILDSYAFLDDFAWGCNPTGAPSTEPEG